MRNHTTVKGAMERFKINGTHPLQSPGDTVDTALSQAHALLTLLSGAHSVCNGITQDEADGLDNIRHEITSVALDGICTLIAFALFNHDIARASARGE